MRRADLKEDLEVEIRNLTILQTLCRRYIEGEDFSSLLQEIVEAAITVTRADKGNLQFLDPSTGVLRIVAHKNFGPRFLKFFEEVKPGHAASCGIASQRSERVIVEDITTSPIFQGSDALDVLLDESVRACQSTPLHSRSGSLLGVFSTHFTQIHAPSDRELRVIDILSHLAADIIERERAEEDLRKAREDLELRVQERTAELEEANEALQQSEEKYRTLIDNIQDGVFVIQDGTFQFVNEAFSQMFGYTVNEVIGKEFLELVAPEDRALVIDNYRRRQAGEDIPREYELRALHKDGQTRVTVNVNAGVMLYNGKIASIGTVKDITEKKNLEAQLLRAQRLESIGRLAGGIAHDLNNLLTPTTISLHILKEKYTDEESQQLLSLIDKNTWRAADLITKLLTFARGVEVDRRPLEISHLVQETRNLIRETFPRNIKIRTFVRKNLYNTLGDTTQLHQVLMNLCLNARDAMPDGGILTIRAENTIINEDYARANPEAKSGRYVALKVSDTGVGIPAAVRDKMFEPFFTTKDQSKGSGLGLSIALGVVKNHGGFIDVFSEVGKGSVFKVYLPAVKTSETTKINRKEQATAPTTGQGEVILVVEDEPSVLETTRRALERQGYKIITATDGAEAITIYTHNKDVIRAVLLDMMMPVMDGDTAIKTLRKINPDVKIIAVSGYAKKDRYEKSIENTQAFLMKPYTSNELLKSIHQVLTAR